MDAALDVTSGDGVVWTGYAFHNIAETSNSDMFFNFTVT